MPNCLQNMSAHGEYGNDIRAMLVPDPLVAICPGDFLTSETVDSNLEAALISSVPWDTNLAGTQEDAKVAFQGVSFTEIDADECLEAPQCVSYANYPYRQDSAFNRSYEIVDANGVAEPTTWIKGQGFTFGKDPLTNALSNHTIQKTATANLIVFRAIESSGPTARAVARVQFAD